MATSTNGQTNLRKALGALKDSTTVGLAKVNSVFKDLEVAIVKATSHEEDLPKDKFLRSIFDAVSSTRPRADVAYCIHALGKRLVKTRNWTVALKTLIVIHRALREADPTFREEFANHRAITSGHILNLSHFKDDSSPEAWDYSAWIREYALYLEERLECYHVLKCDIETHKLDMFELEKDDLLDHIPALQRLMSRLLACQPEGASMHNYLIRHAYVLVAGERVRIYNAITDGMINLVDKFFSMGRIDRLRALDIYVRCKHQCVMLEDFYDASKRIDPGRGLQNFKIEHPTDSFLEVMKKVLQVASESSSGKVKATKVSDTPKPLALTWETDKKAVSADNSEQQLPPNEFKEPEPSSEEVSISPVVVHLVEVNEASKSASELDERNAEALAIVPVESSAAANNAEAVASTSAGWELALVSESSYNVPPVQSKLGGGLDKFTLDSLYDDANARRSNQYAGNPMVHDPFYASMNVSPPVGVQMASLSYQQMVMAQQNLLQQQMLYVQQQHNNNNPFADPYGQTGFHQPRT